ncbi:putative dephospho-CoA kinase [Babesia divergens]|uniref:Dephospho-CoA kinase n=1 Tax=Babesia divergens TaxID=32595 RepID=A0AAD9LGW2_BABDI|nr:putative dephospho-CoA kinase [Babesia divergens]
MADDRTLSSLISRNPLDVLCVLILLATALLNGKLQHRRNGLASYIASFAVLGALLVNILRRQRSQMPRLHLCCDNHMYQTYVCAGYYRWNRQWQEHTGMMADQGYTVIDCDAINREVCGHRIKNIFYQFLLPGSPAYASVIRKFGASIVLDNGEIDRARLRDIIFNDESKRLQLNKCLHTYIGLRVICNIFKYRILHWRQHVVLDIPLLYNTPLVLISGPIVVVTASKELRLERLRLRDPSIPRDLLLNIMKSQVPDTVLRSWGDIVLENSGSLDSFAEQAEALISRL